MNRPYKTGIYESLLNASNYIDDLNEYCNALERALYKACEILEEGYGEEYASYEYFPNDTTVVKIPKFYSADAWVEWLMKDE